MALCNCPHLCPVPEGEGAFEITGVGMVQAFSLQAKILSLSGPTYDRFPDGVFAAGTREERIKVRAIDVGFYPAPIGHLGFAPQQDLR
jgi:hypothetical protein